MAEFYYDTNAKAIIAQGETPLDNVPVHIVAVPRIPDSAIPLSQVLHSKAPVPKAPACNREEAWDRDSCVGVGRWLLNVLEGDGQPPAIVTGHITQLRRLGVGPTRVRIIDIFGSISEFRQAVGSPEPGRANFSNPCVPMTYVWELDREEERYPEALMLDWGVRVIAANPKDGITSDIVHTLAAENHGPSVGELEKIFGSLPGFIEAARKEQECQEAKRAKVKQVRIRNYTQLIRLGQIPKELAELTEDNGQLGDRFILACAKFFVVDHITPTASTESKVEATQVPLKTFVQEMKDRSRTSKKPSTPGDASKTTTLSDAEVERITVHRHVQDDIFPQAEDITHLHVTPDADKKPFLPRILYNHNHDQKECH